MINLIVYITLLCCMNVVSASAPAQERYLQANKLYEQGQIKKAYDIYRGISYKNPEFLINKGNAAYQIGLLPEALVLWRRAQQQVSVHDYVMLEQRINAIEQEQGGIFHAAVTTRILRQIELCMRYIPQKVWQIIFLCILSLGLLVITWFKRGSWFLMVTWLCLLLVVGALLMVRYTVQNRIMGFVLHDTAAYVHKNSQARIKATFRRSQEVEVRAIHDNWYLVTDGNVTGWVAQNDLQLV